MCLLLGLCSYSHLLVVRTSISDRLQMGNWRPPVAGTPSGAELLGILFFLSCSFLSSGLVCMLPAAVAVREACVLVIVSAILSLSVTFP